LAQSAGRILVVDDDPDTRTLIQDILDEEDYEVQVCSSGEHALALLGEERFDVVLSDIKMPGISGTDILLHVRRKNLDTEVVLMTAYASVQSAVEALRGEAFDYLTKPFSLRELRQVIRQAIRTHPAPRQGRAVMHYKDLSVDQKARRVWVTEREVKLTRLEFDVLAYLFDNMGDTISRQELLERVWGCNASGERSDDTVKSCISRLRRKLGDNAQNTVYIHNVWGVGYKLGD
jgi:DNA-binding response OmpR family regulator